jgi:hypothetical protein
MKSHVHKYMRVKYGGRRIVKDPDGSRRIIKDPKSVNEVFKCMVPGCTSFMPRELVMGSLSLCWVCNHVLVLTGENTKLRKPTHEFCRKVREEVA